LRLALVNNNNDKVLNRWCIHQKIIFNRSSIQACTLWRKNDVSPTLTVTSLGSPVVQFLDIKKIKLNQWLNVKKH